MVTGVGIQDEQQAIKMMGNELYGRAAGYKSALRHDPGRDRPAMGGRAVINSIDEG